MSDGQSMDLVAKVPLAFLLLGLLLVVACGDRRDKAYAEGWNDGYDEGLSAGRTEGRSQAEADHQKRWGLVGLGIGVLLGGALVSLATRRYIAERWRTRCRRKEVERMVGSCPLDLDAELHDEVLGIARKKAALLDRLERDEGPLIVALRDRIRPALVRIDTQLLKIAALLQHLRDLRRETGGDVDREERALKERSVQDDVDDGLFDLEARRRNEVQKNASNIVRCERQLAGLAVFLDELLMRVGNLKTFEEADAFDRFEEEVSAEVEALGTAFEATLARLTQSAQAS